MLFYFIKKFVFLEILLKCIKFLFSNDLLTVEWCNYIEKNTALYKKVCDYGPKLAKRLTLHEK